MDLDTCDAVYFFKKVLKVKPGPFRYSFPLCAGNYLDSCVQLRFRDQTNKTEESVQAGFENQWNLIKEPPEVGKKELKKRLDAARITLEEYIEEDLEEKLFVNDDYGKKICF